MITLRKLQTLKTRTLMRKMTRICHQFEEAAAAGVLDYDQKRFIADMILVLLNRSDISLPFRKRLEKSAERADALLREVSREKHDLQWTWAIADLRYLLMEETGEQAGDWDMRDAAGASLQDERRKVFPVRVFIDHIRSPFNVGSVFRTAESFGVRDVVLAPGSASPDHPRAKRSAMGCVDVLPWKFCEEGSCADAAAELSAGESSESAPVFALELGGTPVDEFAFPERGMVIIGSEELGVSPELLAAADADLGRVSIPTCGAKGSLNVSVAFGILMQRWYASLCRDASERSEAT